MNENSEVASDIPMPVWAERHYEVNEMASFWSLSHDSITRMFRNEPGVVVVTPRKRAGHRTRITLRIPQHVADRVYQRITKQ